MKKSWMRMCAAKLLFAMGAMMLIARGLALVPAYADAATPQSINAVLAPLDYKYNTSWGGLGIGQIEVSLKPDVATNCYIYSTISHPTSLVRSLYGAPNQSSQFCIKNGSVRSEHFNSVLPGDDKQSYMLNFDWDKHVVVDENGASRPLPDEAVDSFALQQAVRLWVKAHAGDANPPVAQFTMVDNKNFTHYQFRLLGHETITIAAGTFDTLKMERIDNPQKEGHFWVSPERDYMPIKIETRNGNKPSVTLELAK